MAEFVSASAADTMCFAEDYAKTLCAGDVVLLDGEMGAGKTVFAKGVAKGLGPPQGLAGGGGKHNI